VVVNSSSLDKRKEKSIRHQIEKEEQTLTKGLVGLAKTRYACQPDAEKSFQNWLAKQKPKYHHLQLSVVMENVIDKRNHRGRPRRDEAEPTFQTVYRLVVKITGRDEVAIQKTYDLARTFILISNTPEVPGAEILRDYKDQFKVEQRFGFLKDPY
jgi:transposase